MTWHDSILLTSPPDHYENWWEDLTFSTSRMDSISAELGVCCSYAMVSPGTMSGGNGMNEWRQ